MNEKTILYLYTKTGSGHIESAKAIQSALDQLQPGKYRHIFYDYVKSSSRFMNLFSVAYAPMIRITPWLWKILYHFLGNDLPLAFFERLARLLMLKRISNFFLDQKPDIIVSVHPFANHLAARAIKMNGQKTPFVIIVTDPFSFHKTWLVCNKYIDLGKETTLAIVASEEAKIQALKVNFPESKIKIIGLPLRMEFNKTISNKSLNHQLNVLFMGGGDGAGIIYDIVKKLKINDYLGKITVVCGNNTRLRKKITQLTTNWSTAKCEILGYTNEISNLMVSSDLLVTKAGPATIFEAISRKLPMIINYIVPGQEEGNAKFVEAKNIGYIMSSSKEITRKILELDHNRSELQKVLNNISNLPENFATLNIAREIISLNP